MFKDPVRSSDPLFTVLAVNNDRRLARLGLAISKKTVSKASQRNRIKRQIRESFRHEQHKLLDIDIVVMAKRGLDNRSENEMRQSLQQHWARLVKKCAKS